jgi:hypothetical protein
LHFAASLGLVDHFEIRHATLQPEPMTRTVRWGKPPRHDEWVPKSLGPPK